MCLQKFRIYLQNYSVSNLPTEVPFLLAKLLSFKSAFRISVFTCKTTQFQICLHKFRIYLQNYSVSNLPTEVSYLLAKLLSFKSAYRISVFTCKTTQFQICLQNFRIYLQNYSVSNLPSQVPYLLTKLLSFKSAYRSSVFICKTTQFQICLQNFRIYMENYSVWTTLPPPVCTVQNFKFKVLCLQTGYLLVFQARCSQNALFSSPNVLETSKFVLLSKYCEARDSVCDAFLWDYYLSVHRLFAA
jgi:hypothetical protein